ncbi:MAG: hypothetical protein ACRDHS_15545 [Actinomycetota bacterium]
MADGERGLWGGLAGAAFVVCCALLPAVGIGAGAVSAVAGAALRYWPLTLLGLAGLVWGVLPLARILKARRMSRSFDHEEGKRGRTS